VYPRQRVNEANSANRGRVDPSTIVTSTTWPCPRALRFEDRGQVPEREVQPTTGEVSEHLQQGNRRAATRSDRANRARDGFLVEGMAARHLGQRPVLARAGETRVDEHGLDSKSASGPIPKRSQTPGRNDSANTSAGPARDLITSTPCGFFRSTAIDRRPRSYSEYVCGNRNSGDLGHCVHADHVRAQIGQLLGAERKRAETGEFDESQPDQRPPRRPRVVMHQIAPCDDFRCTGVGRSPTTLRVLRRDHCLENNERVRVACAHRAFEGTRLLRRRRSRRGGDSRVPQVCG